MKRTLLLYAMSMMAVYPALADVGDTFTALTAEGVELRFSVISGQDMSCRLVSVPKGTSGREGTDRGIPQIKLN